MLRAIASLGAGGVLYLTPLVFDQQAFTASSVTQGLALAALAGTLGRFLSGLLLDRGCNCGLPVLLAVLAALAGDSRLLVATNFHSYAQGQLLIGLAMGLYWPAIELAVPLACAVGPRPIPSARGYALVRSADAAGIAGGALIGAGFAAAGQLRGIYVVDVACLITMALLLLLKPLPQPATRTPGLPGNSWGQWLPPLLPILTITLVCTSLPALMQSALPLDLVRGGLARGPLPTSLGALLMALQLGLLLLIQWPVGQALARKPVAVGLKLSLLCFSLGTALLAVSALSQQGIALVIAAQLPLALGEAAFLPIATEAVIELTPERHQGLAMALFSQCFAISAFGAPLLAGRALDDQGHGVGLWFSVSALCLAGLMPLGQIRPRKPATGT
ncbi:MAG TPA: MFS transporter [Synechococcales bacterium UBA10510]|nr:MFS transporter [Synechococcales bacterium UBA10510]